MEPLSNLGLPALYRTIANATIAQIPNMDLRLHINNSFWPINPHIQNIVDAIHTHIHWSYDKELKKDGRPR